MELRVLKNVPVRQKWTKESKGFTPWLAKYISEVNDAVGLELDLEVENIEVGV